MSQEDLFERPEFWRDHWRGMPDFTMEDLEPEQSVIIHFANMEDRRDFAKAMGQTITDKTQSLWYPEAEIGRMGDKRWVTQEPVDPKYPIYIISKGREDTRQTSKALEVMGVPYKIVIEPQEYRQYAAVIDPEKIIILPFRNLGQGSIPVRNWVLRDSRDRGDKRHWIIDDNITGFYRLTDNLKVQVENGATFRSAEEFTDRYENIMLSGFQYFMFASRKSKLPPFVRNTRIYSCILVNNSIPFEWRGRYNEDTDLSIRVLKAGFCTVLFNAFLAMKSTTMTMTGGNTEDLYGEDDSRRRMTESLIEQHPDVVTMTEKWGRDHHQVNYKPFKNNLLKLRPDIEVALGPNNFGMELKYIDGRQE